MDMDRFYSMCLQGNVLEAIKYLKTFKDKNNDILMLIKQYEERFLTDNEVYKIDSDDSWVKDVLNCYLSYFRFVLINNSTEQAEQRLILSLSKLVTINWDSNLDDIESELENIFKEKGYSFLGGLTSSFRGPYIWKNTLKEEFNVSLPDGEHDVVVYFISDFLMLSWAHFATLGKHYAGGWAKPEGLYYVNNGIENIDTNSTKFQVWFLKHEAQHLSDYTNFPNLNGRNLEYRAKLTELIYNPQPYNLIEKFLNQSENDKSIPHSYAAYSIIKQLSFLVFGQEYVYDKEQWKNIEFDYISSFASELLLKDTEELHEAGSETEGII
ncbi:hypothetical protein LGK97_14135 [Clostridium sp. CS001]|uniref:hypothetical protein n=1 Tax=Clostridium sp. CS001 TaxID=2880648 RepID=UPI001CF41C6C|nr:hypothetical protein [Clostridium sp. CS001]MCB2290882.1 hypothetical protein [Clostridium sp. CS001]